ncbi:gamma-tubulin complex component 5 [Topomyia yanbarensis]|uniref:gamma-tubulin complex component 5 n=1 Tax=Topomyia yanbarensis TaxID=2498891 RepID=UPI00273C5795|nr:gamma-tubulin complex component 5 [Topomyia yanbarensis]XP_058822452.1 gamma-tubulin complex component 5 [Topomyia yanbarensis]
MSQALERREATIQQGVSELIRLLTGFEETEENFTICQQFSLATIRNHRFITVNSHEIRRKADGLMENLRISNMERQAEQFRMLFEQFTNDPVCVNHYEHDIQWSVLLFLMTVAHNPIGALKERLRRGSPLSLIEVNVQPAVPLNDDERIELLEDLRADNISVGANDSDDDSELSEWSDSENDEEKDAANPCKIEEQCVTKEVIVFSRVEPPKRDIGYEQFDGSKSKKWLKENIQNCWWKDPKAKADVNSSHEGASFCDYWNQTILKASHSFIKPDPVSTVSEYCLVREILWMFTNPVNCKFFRIDDDQVWINPNVSLSSATERGLHTFLLNFTEHMTIVYRLRNFCLRVSETTNSPIPAPYSFECYASAVRNFLDHLQATVVELEKQAIAQQPDRIFTIITLFHDLEPEFQLLKNLNDIHRFSVLDWTKFPAHIAVAHLLSGLFRSVKLSGNLEKTNLAFALLLSTLKGYMNIIDIWWTGGRLDDWRGEFLVEKTYAEDASTETGYRARLFSKCKQRSFYVSSVISEVIENDAIIQLLMHHSLEAGYTLNILNGLDRISDLRSGCESDESMVYVGFLETIVEVLEGFRTDDGVIAEETCDDVSRLDRIAKDTVNTTKLQNLRNQIKEICDDEMLMMALDCSLQLACTDEQTEAELQSEPNADCLTNAYSLYNRVNSISSHLMLPLEQVLFSTIKNLMETKRQAANHFVTTIYKEEFLVLNHLKNIRKVLLLEASDLMYYFYSDLFRRIEAGESWANPYLLTIQLNDILASRFTDMTSLFTIEILSEYKAETTTVLDAIDKLRILYNPSNDLSNMINEETMTSYNCVFRFLLKVKWALCTLESLRYPECYKRRPPYEEPCVLDLNLKRLAMLKFWMIFTVQCIHSHLMTHVLQSLGMQLDERLDAADNLNDMIAVHQSYISTIYEHCFQREESKLFHEGVIRLLNLVHIVRDEWNNNVVYSEMDARGDIEDNSMIGEFISNAQVGMLEQTYCLCHQELVKLLNKEVYTKHKAHLAAFADALSYNIPY